MPRRDLDERLAALEARVTPASALRPEEIAEITVRIRADGKSDREVSLSLNERDPSLMMRGLIQLAQYSIHDSPLIRLPHKWAAGHRDPLVSIVGRLQECSFSVLGPGGEHHPVGVPARLDWRELDPLVVYFLGLLVRHEGAWVMYWSRPAEIRAEYGLAGFYLATATHRAARLKREDTPKQVAEISEAIQLRIDWITAQAEEPERLPWEKETAI